MVVWWKAYISTAINPGEATGSSRKGDGNLAATGHGKLRSEGEIQQATKDGFKEETKQCELQGKRKHQGKGQVGGCILPSNFAVQMAQERYARGHAGREE